MMVRGNAETFGSSVPNRAYKIKGLIVEVPSNYNPETRQYSGIWDGTFKNAWTDNPAWVLRDIIESGRYGLKKFFPPAKQGNTLCDKWTLYEIAKYCDEYVSDGNEGMEPRYTFNGQIMGSGSAREVLQSIASNFHGMMYWGSGMVMARGQERCVYLLPQSEFRRIAVQIQRTSMGNKAARDYLRVFLSGAVDQEPDKQGRVLVPQMLRDYANLDSDIVVIGVGTRAEIWNRQAWEDYLADKEQGYSDIADDVLPAMEF